MLLRLLLDDVLAQHRAARALLEGGGTFAVSPTAVVEAVFVLGRAYGLSRPEQYEAIVGILSLPAIESDSNAVIDAFDLFLAHPKLSFEDCLLVATAERQDAGPLWTFDKKLASQSSAQLVGGS